MSGKKAFIMYMDYENVFLSMPAESVGNIVKAIYTYLRTGDTGDLDPIERTAFLFIRNNLDRDAKKYEETVRARSEAGKKHGAKYEAMQQSLAEENKQEQMKTNGTDKEKEKEKENDTVIVIEKEKEKDKVPARCGGRKKQTDPMLSEGARLLFERALNPSAISSSAESSMTKTPTG